MRRELEELLLAKYPVLFKGRLDRNSCMYRGIECGDGWFNLIDLASKEIENEISSLTKEEQEQFCYSQIKEKFGVLVLYLEKYNATLSNITSKYTSLSCETCMHCGKHSGPTPFQASRFNNYIMTLCDSCSVKEKERRFK